MRKTKNTRQLRSFGRMLTVAALALGLADRAAGQSAAGIFGLITDESGAPLPGVTVQISSPALIEGVRTAVTAADGRYQVVDLRPGNYVVTFTLSGFQTVRRERIRAQHRVHRDGRRGAAGRPARGAGHRDRRGAAHRRAIGHVRAAAHAGAARGHPGRPHSQCRGDARARRDHRAAGRRRFGNRPDGERVDSRIAEARSGVEHRRPEHDRRTPASGGVSGQYPNQGAYQEVVVQTRALPAEIGAGGVSVNMITKDGGNRFRGELFGTFTGSALQSSNVSDEQSDARADRPERDRRLLRPQRRRRRPDRRRQAVVLRQRRAASASIASRRTPSIPTGRRRSTRT